MWQRILICDVILCETRGDKKYARKEKSRKVKKEAVKVEKYPMKIFFL